MQTHACTQALILCKTHPLATNSETLIQSLTNTNAHPLTHKLKYTLNTLTHQLSKRAHDREKRDAES